MNRRKFLKFLGIGAAVTPLLPLAPKAIPRQKSFAAANAAAKAFCEKNPMVYRAYVHPDHIARFKRAGQPLPKWVVPTEYIPFGEGVNADVHALGKKIDDDMMKLWRETHGRQQ